MREILFKAKRIDNGEWVEETLKQTESEPYMQKGRDIIRKHMNDGWISVEETLPEIKGCYLVTIQRSGDYERPELDVMSNYFIKEHGLWSSEVFSHDHVIAWQPLPEPYRPEQPETCKYTGGSCCWPIDQCRDCPNHPERSDYFKTSKNKNEIKFENNSKDMLSSVLMMILNMWKQHIYYLNQEQNRYLAELRDAMIPDLMTGKISI